MCMYEEGGYSTKKKQEQRIKPMKQLHSVNTQIVDARVEIGEEDEEEKKDLCQKIMQPYRKKMCESKWHVDHSNQTRCLVY